MEGYEAKFDPPLDKRLECPICLLAQREPMQTPCGHRFCSSCILRALRETGPRCPVDNTRVSNHQLFKDNFAKREVLSLNVKCSAEDVGCSWHGELRNLEMHVGVCGLVRIECPNCCGYYCQRKDLSPHLPSCLNKPEQCLYCSVHLAKNKLEDHRPHCSKIILPDSILSKIFEGNEVLKWCGSIKLKVTSACSVMFQQSPNTTFHVSGYLTAKAESPESFMYTGNWSCSLSVMPLNSPSAKIFWRMLHGPEVQLKTFSFGLLSSDGKSNLFAKVLKKKVIDLSAIVGLHLKPGQNRTDLTIIYFYWSEGKRRLMACVAELKSHLVRQIQNRLHLLQQNNSRRARTSGSDPHSSRVQSHSRSQMRGSDRPHQSRRHYNVNDPSRSAVGSPYMVPPPPPPPPPAAQAPPPGPPGAAPGHMTHHHHHVHHRHMHPRHPTMTLVTPGPTPHLQQQTQSHLLPPQMHPEPSDQSGIVHPRILSWQMSQSLNGYPWRVQTGNVPFFTFPSTPPSFLPSSSYPYTFAPAPPFSINQIARVPTTAVPVPSYAGIAVPQVTGVDSIVAGPNGAAFPVAAIPSLNDVPSEHMHPVPPGAVTVTIPSGNPVPGQAPPPAAAVVIQQSVVHPSQEANTQAQDMAVIHTITAPPHGHFQAPSIPAHIAPAIITAEGAQGPAGPPVAAEGMRYHGPIMTALPPQLVSVGAPQHNMVGVSLDYALNATTAAPVAAPPPPAAREHSDRHSRTHARDHRSEARPDSVATHSRTLRDPRLAMRHVAHFNDGAGPSRALDSDTTSDSDSLNSDSPRQNFFYGSQAYPQFDNDSDDSMENPESNDSMMYRPSDADDSSSPSDSENNSPTNPSTLRFITGNAANVVSAMDNMASPANESGSDSFLTDESVNAEQGDTDMANSPDDDSDSLSLPVLINISDSSDGLNSHLSTPTPTNVIDLTASPGADSPSVSETRSSISLPLPAHPPNAALASTSNPHVIESTAAYENPEPNPPVFLPVINPQNPEGPLEAIQVVSRREPAEIQVIAQHNPVEYYGAAIPRAALTDEADPVVAQDGQQQQQEVHLVGHPIMQLPPHATQLYAAQGQLASGGAHLIAPPPPTAGIIAPPPQATGIIAPPPPAAHGFAVATAHHDHHTTQPLYPSFPPPHLPPPQTVGPPAPAPVEVQQVALPPAALEPHPPPVHAAMLESVAHGNVHVLRWQQAMSQQQALNQQQQHPGDLVPPPAHPAPAPPHPPTAYPGMEPVPHPTPLNSYTSHQVGESSSTQQMPAGNFWETVMPSLDMSLQGNVVTSNESTH